MLVYVDPERSIFQQVRLIDLQEITVRNKCHLFCSSTKYTRIKIASYREEFCSLLAYFSDALEHVTVPIPAILKPVELWTGKQVFTIMVQSIGKGRVVNFQCKEKNYTRNKHFCLNDGWVNFLNSELISGNIAKKTIGDGSKTGLIFVLLRDLGANEAAEFMNKFSRLCSRVMGAHKGLSIGVGDVTPSVELNKIKHNLLSEGFSQVCILHNLCSSLASCRGDFCLLCVASGPIWYRPLTTLQRTRTKLCSFALAVTYYRVSKR